MNELGALTPTHLRELAGFVTAARFLNFARASREVGCSPSVLSRRIASLESRVGGRVFLRSTRRMTLTPLGESLLSHCERLETALAAVNAELLGHRAEPAGLVRLHLPTTYGRRCVAPLLPGLLSKYPRLRLDVTFDDGYADLVATRTDIALRIGVPADSGLSATSLRPIRRFLVASARYLADAPALERPEDLKEHRCLALHGLRSGELWTFERQRQRRVVRVRPVLRANNADALLEAALAGSGVALLADFVAGDAIAAGNLVEVMTGWTVTQPEVQLLWVSGAERMPRVRATIDLLRERLGR
ncbi:LysR family transcriptional regulator [Luteimonas sp. RD2P54]|uniref:LysR family transcriptional regulator n=1 Tax=Luteimonas endophytica TaxID=3042023 RepID=A0ABT6JCD2_9GAMM|nr:LysR family transcriptional regulator [Luteimonas endophytica]MDH5824225.1 LysR family transcriptional regulator [Luteimonas endophytica]